MDVLILGHDTSYSLANSYARAFGEVGAEVQLYCMRSAYEQAFPGSQTRVGKRLFGSLIARAFNHKVRSDLCEIKPDLVFVIKGRHLSADTISVLKNRFEVPVVNFYPDDPFTDVRANRLTYGPSVLSAYDSCFTFARHLIPKYQEAGAMKTKYLPFARDPAHHAPPENPPSRPPYDVVFVGNLDETRVRWLEALTDFRIAIHGENTKAAIPFCSDLRDADFFSAAYGPDMAEALKKGAISINIMRRQNEGSHNMRSFDSLACGAFTLSQRTPELVELFIEGKEIACFNSPIELQEQVRYWLAHPKERRRVARNGFRRVEEDTYQQRATTLLETVSAWSKP